MLASATALYTGQVNDVTKRYAKGTARRAEILAAALVAYSASSRSAPRLRDIAQAVNLTEAGVLHYFESKDHLFVAILEARDDDAAKRYDLHTEAGLWAYLEETVCTPGLTKLFVDMSTAASDPQHPAHAFLARHDPAVRQVVRAALNLADPWAEELLIAAAEGLQLRWLREPQTDLIGELRRLVALLKAQPRHS